MDLKLENVEELSHNAKKFRFALPDKNDVSGLEVACTWKAPLLTSAIFLADVEQRLS